MSNNDKNIVITPNVGQTADPQIDFTGASSVISGKTISLKVYPVNNGTLSFEGTAGQLFSITDDLTGVIFSVNDISGIPSFEVNADGTVSIAEFSGNVGIGTSSPTQKLDVEGQIRLRGGSPTAGRVLVSDADGVGSWQELSQVSGVTGTGVAGRVTFWTGTDAVGSSANLFWNNSNNRLGIGTASPNTPLEVVGDIHVSGGDRTIFNRSNNFLAFGTNNTERIRINPGGDIIVFDGLLGLGITNPAQKLHVVGDINVNSGNGYRINNTATSGQYLRGDGTKFVSSTIQASDVPTLNQNTTGQAGSVANALTAGDGLTSTGTYNGSVARTFSLTGQALALHNLATNGIIARTAANTVAARTITAGTGISVSNGDGVSGNPTIANTAPNENHTGDVTGATVLTIANSVVTNAKMANMAANTIKGRITSSGAPQDLTAAQVRTLLNVADGATANAGTVTSVGSGDGLTGGPITGSGTLAVDTTVIRTTGNQTLGGTKTFSSAVVFSGATSGTITLTATAVAGTTTLTMPATTGTLALTSQLPTVNNGTLTVNTSGTGISGSGTFTANQSGNSTITITSNATNANTVSTIVARDASGNFSAGTITAALSGNATTATTLQTTRQINGTNFNGSANITTANWGTARNITIGNTLKSVNGSDNYDWTLADIGIVANYNNTSIHSTSVQDFSVGATGWRRIAQYSGVSTHGRGRGEVSLMIVGGTPEPRHLTVTVFKNWSNAANGIIGAVEYFGNMVNAVRFVVDSGVYYIEANFIVTVPVGRTYSKRYGFNEYISIAGELPVGGGTVLESRIFSGGISNAGYYFRRVFSEKMAIGGSTNPDFDSNHPTLINASDVDNGLIRLAKTGGNPSALNLEAQGDYNAIHSTNSVRGGTARAFRIYVGPDQRFAIDTTGIGIFENDIKVGADTSKLDIGFGPSNAPSNTRVGQGALESVSTGTSNTAIGQLAVRLTTTGGSNTAVGQTALRDNTTGSNNTAIGQAALRAVSGNNNTAVGKSALQDGTSFSGNTAVGREALRRCTTINNTAVGDLAAAFVTSGTDIVAIGRSSLALGAAASHNTAIGALAMQSVTGTSNTGVGRAVLFGLTTGTNNVAVGREAGRYAGSGTTANQTSSNSIYLGYFSRASANGNTNEIVVGYDVVGGGSNTSTLGNTDTVRANIYGTIHADGYAMTAGMIINQTTTSRTLLASDNGKVIRCSNSGNTTITVPSGLGAGYSVTIIQENTGQVTIAESGVNVENRQNHTKTAGRWATVSLVAITANNFVLAGDTAS